MLPESGITGLRLEALADPNFRRRPGRGNGNFVLNELIAERFDPAAPEKLMRLSFGSPTADFAKTAGQWSEPLMGMKEPVGRSVLK